MTKKSIASNSQFDLGKTVLLGMPAASMITMWVGR